MAKFIELHETDGTTSLVNLDRVVRIIKTSSGCLIDLTDNVVDIDDGDTGFIRVRESYRDVKRLVGNAQGGIPMPREHEHI